MTKISSLDLNTKFNKKMTELVDANKSSSGYKSLSFNFDMITLGATAGATGLIGTVTDMSTRYDAENLEQIFRIYDDVQIVGVVADLWGLDRSGVMANELPASNILAKQSNAICFSLKILGNYTKIDDELGYPAIYKSTEFNLVNDITLEFKDADGFTDRLPGLLPAFVFASSYKSNENYLDADDAPRTVPSRQLFFPIEDTAESTMLHGGAEYIISLSPKDLEDNAVEDAESIPAIHLITSLQLTLICQVSRRRFS